MAKRKKRNQSAVMQALLNDLVSDRRCTEVICSKPVEIDGNKKMMMIALDFNFNLFHMWQPAQKRGVILAQTSIGWFSLSDVDFIEDEECSILSDHAYLVEVLQVIGEEINALCAGLLASVCAHDTAPNTLYLSIEYSDMLTLQCKKFEKWLQSCCNAALIDALAVKQGARTSPEDP